MGHTFCLIYLFFFFLVCVLAFHRSFGNLAKLKRLDLGKNEFDAIVSLGNCL